METITLTAQQINVLTDELDDIRNENGSFDIDIEIDDSLTINAAGYVETDGYIEDDYHCGYMNGTGAYVETYRSASVELKATVYDGDDNATEYNVDAGSVRAVEEYLNEDYR